MLSVQYCVVIGSGRRDRTPRTAVWIFDNCDTRVALRHTVEHRLADGHDSKHRQCGGSGGPVSARYQFQLNIGGVAGETPNISK